MKPGRNDPCPCGSGKKYKRCCAEKHRGIPPQKIKVNVVLPSAISSELFALFNAGRHSELEARTRSILAQYPDSGFAWKLLGAALKEQGKDALAAFQNAARLTPDSADVFNNLGLVLQEIGQHDQAVACYRKALKISPNHAEIHLNLGNTLLELGHIDDAMASYRRALDIQPELAEAHCGLGATQRDLGHIDDAMASYRRALGIQPELAEAHCGLGAIQRDLGHLDEALKSYHRALEIKPDFIEGRLELARAEKIKSGDKNLAALIAYEDLSRNGNIRLSFRNMMLLHSALGKCCDDIGEYEKAFPHFLEGNRLKRATFDYNPERMTQYFESIIHNFDLQTIDRLRGGGNPSRLPIFILGMPRSGTTLIEQIIASHPNVQGAGELSYLMTIAQHDLEGTSYPGNLRLFCQTHITACGNEYVAALQQHAPDMPRITDKMPLNFLALGLIHLILPNARIIHVKRNPVDTCLSCFTQQFASGNEYSYDLAELGRYYADYFRLMQHWRAVLPEGAFLDVQYEDVVADQENQSRRIIEYCGLEWNDACLDFHKNKRAVQTASVAQVRQPMYKSSVARWRNYEKFLGPLFEALGDLVPDLQ